MMKVAGDISLPLPPDWRELLNAKSSPLNPHWFPYGSFPLYLLRLGGNFGAFFKDSLNGYPDLRLVGRVLSALFDTATVLAVYLLGRRLYGRRYGLLAAALLTFTVLSIQLSHFFTVDPMLTTFATFSVLVSARIMHRADLRGGALLGVLLGLALATKVSAAPFAVTALIAYGIFAFAQESDEMRLSYSEVRMGKALRSLLLAAVVAGAVFFITQPYAALDWRAFVGDTSEQSEMARGIRDYPYTRQYINTTPVLYQVQQLATWGMGLPLGIAAWGGLLFTAAVAIRRRRKADILLLAALVPYFLAISTLQVKYLRYLLPIVPVLCLMAAHALLALRERLAARRLWKVPRWSGNAIIAFIIITAILYSLAYVRIYTRPHAAVTMSRWINANVPQQNRILKEHWEESVPDLNGYPQDELGLYEPDTGQKMQKLIGQLQKADYIVLYSNRLYGSIARLPQRYPMTTEYYRMLFSGELGFRLLHEETGYPGLAGISIVNDTLRRPGLLEPQGATRPSRWQIKMGYADESFTVYDHPRVMLFEKQDLMPEEQLRARLSAALPTVQTPVLATGLLLSEADAKAQQQGGTWSQIFHRGSLPNRLPVLFWLLAVELLALPWVPIAFAVFRPLADRGYLFAKLLGILGTAYLVWLAASVHIATFSRTAILGAALLTYAIGIPLYLLRRREIHAFFANRWRSLLFGEGLFLIAFFAFVGIRMWNPDLWHPYRGGEKPMDFAYLNAVVKSTYFPPYDPWFSGGYLNYYYFGQVLVATLIKLTGIVPAVAYNLAVPLFFALTLAGAFSVVYNLTCAATAGRNLRRWAHPLLAGLLGSVFVAVLGNLDGLGQLFEGLAKAGNLRFHSSIPGLDWVVRAGAGVWPALTRTGAYPPFDFWRSSRLMAPGISITEFPYFTYLFADLHAHLLALPSTIVAIGVALSLVLAGPPSPGRGKGLMGRISARLSPQEVGLLAVLALLLGGLRWTNTWDFPTYLLLAGLALLIGEHLAQHGWGLTVWLRAGARLAFVYGLSVLLFLPLQSHYQLFYKGVVKSPEKTQLYQYLAMFGLFLFLAGSFLIERAFARYVRSATMRTASYLLRHWRRLPQAIALRRRLATDTQDTPWLALSALLIVAGIAAILFLLDLQVVGFLFLAGLLLLIVLVGEMTSQSPAQGPGLLVVIMVGLAFALGSGVEFVAVKGDVGRMNTVFRFYLQSWVLLALSAAYGLWWLIGGRPAQRAGDNTSRRPRIRIFQWGWLAALLFLLGGSIIYPLAATRVRANDRFAALPPSLNGMAYMAGATYRDERGPLELKWDYDAIRWLQDNVAGSPVIVEGLTPLYRWGGRVSVYTGLPAVIGWDWHQKQQRWAYQSMVDQRLRDVEAIYTTREEDAARKLLQKYNVRYVYVGELEQRYYGVGGLAKFESMVGKGLRVAYRNDKVTIYEVGG
ncbi:MAG: glycosyltransferase family 39 protein [Chloroflexi bacterium]|nr:glycosyltransferase family 39 protein [Chloroflexota bacterium]